MSKYRVAREAAGAGAGLAGGNSVVKPVEVDLMVVAVAAEGGES
jgi:hypothetical protein